MAASASSTISTRALATSLSLALLLLSPAAVGAWDMLDRLQRHLIYFPEHGSADTLKAKAAGIGLEPWYESGGGALIGWRTPAELQPERRMLVFHGNAGHALHRAYFAAGLSALNQCWSVFLFEYPGYGAREGQPSEATIKAAAGRALQSLLRDDARPVFLLGESLGSGVASYLAGEYPQQVEGLLLVTPFTRLADVASHHYSWLPVESLLTETYDNQSALAAYQGPVAFLLAGADEVVPTELGRQLHAHYRGPRRLWVQAGAGHNTLDYSPSASWWREVTDFLTTGGDD